MAPNKEKILKIYSEELDVLEDCRVPLDMKVLDQKNSGLKKPGSAQNPDLDLSLKSL
jgi:hypothetical protein